MGLCYVLLGLSEKFVDIISIFNEKRNEIEMNISAFAKKMMS